MSRDKNYQPIILGSTLVFLVVLMAILTGGKLLEMDSLQAIAFQIPLLGILTLAQMTPMLTGGIDLSIISTANLSGILAAMVLTHIPTGYGTVLAVIAGVTTALAVGVLNGILIAFLYITPIIATLATMILIKGVALAITKGYIISGFPDSFSFISNGEVWGIPMPFIIFIVFAVLLAIILSKTTFGISVYMIGSNPTATSFSGVNNKKILFNVYLLSGFLAGIASIIMISRFNAAQAAYGESYLLLTVLACVLGGVNPAGGFGKVSGLLAAVIVLQTVSIGFNLLRLSSHLTDALWGIILLTTVVINRAITGKWIE